MEAAGIEPASENDPLEILHACPIPIYVVSRPKGIGKLAGTPAH